MRLTIVIIAAFVLGGCDAQRAELQRTAYSYSYSSVSDAGANRRWTLICEVTGIASAGEYTDKNGQRQVTEPEWVQQAQEYADRFMGPVVLTVELTDGGMTTFIMHTYTLVTDTRTYTMRRPPFQTLPISTAESPDEPGVFTFEGEAWYPNPGRSIVPTGLSGGLDINRGEGEIQAAYTWGDAGHGAVITWNVTCKGFFPQMIYW